MATEAPPTGAVGGDGSTSTPAPAAPSTSSGNSAGNSAGTAPREIRPIPSRPVLPGIRPDRMAGNPEGNRDGVDRDLLGRPRGPQARDENGRFSPLPSSRSAQADPSGRGGVDPDRPADAVAAPTPAPADPLKAPAPGQPAPGAAPFEVAGKKFASKQEADQKIGSLYGSFKSAVKAANAWKDYAENEVARLQAENEQLRSGRPVAASAGPSAGTGTSSDPSSTSVPAGLKSLVDDEAFLQKFETVAKTHDTLTAVLWAIGEAQRHTVEQLIEPRLTEALAPVAEMQRSRQYSQAERALFTQLADYRNPENEAEPYYPELRDPRLAPVIVDLWRRNSQDWGLTPEQAFTPHAVHNAVLLYRAWAAQVARPSSTPAAAASPATAAVPPGIEPPPPPAALLSTAAPVGAAGGARLTPEQSAVANLKDGIARANSRLPGYGFKR